jgi:HflK protein
MTAILQETARILIESAPYLLLGFLLAGLLHVVLRRATSAADRLRDLGARSVITASIIGVPLPLCSCGVLPTALALRRKGASRGATLSFLISTPETDVVSIVFTYALLGPVYAIFRPIAALITAIIAGVATNWFDRRSQGTEPPELPTMGGEYLPERGYVYNALHFSFVRFFDDIAAWLTLSLILAGVIAAWLPDLRLETVTMDPIWSMLIMLVIGIPMYVCATASTPIAAGLILAGVNPGAALVFLLAGPATNITGVVMLAKYLGRRAVVIYLATIAICSLLAGLLLNALLSELQIDPQAVARATMTSGPSVVELAGCVLLVVLLANSLRRTGAVSKLIGRAGGAVGLDLAAWPGKVAGALLLIALYIGTGLYVIEPGERGIETTFGRIVADNVEPGLHYCWPYPIGAVDVERFEETKRVEVGYRLRKTEKPPPPDQSVADEDFIAESWMLTGDENIVDIKYAVQYRIAADGLVHYSYGLAQKEGLVRDAAEAAFTGAVATQGIDTLLTTARDKAEELALQAMQAYLDQCQAGLTVTKVALLDVHAPPKVHPAFRDIASAAEDKEKAINEAHEYEARIVPNARGQAKAQVLAAQGNAVRAVNIAEGEATAFNKVLAAYQQAPWVTRLRMYLDNLDRTLPTLKKYLELLGPNTDLDIWMLSGKATELPQFELPTAGQRRPSP